MIRAIELRPKQAILDPSNDTNAQIRIKLVIYDRVSSYSKLVSRESPTPNFGIVALFLD